MYPYPSDPTDFAVACVEGKPFDVRRMIFAVQHPDVLRGALEALEASDGDERLMGWISLRLSVLDVMSFTDKVEAGEAAPASRRRSRPKSTAVQTTLLPMASPQPSRVSPLVEPVAVPVVDLVEQPPEILVPLDIPLDDEGETGPTGDVSGVVGLTVGPILAHATDPDVVAPVKADTLPVDVQDPRPALFVPVPKARKPNPLERLYAAELQWVIWYVRTFWDRERGEARVHRSAISALASAQPDNVLAQWGLDRWHRQAWAWGAPLETIAAVLGLEATFSGRVLVIRDAERTSSA